MKDIHEALDVTVYDEDPNKRSEFLGRVLIPLLNIKNDEKKWYTLKDKKCIHRSKGQILLQMTITYNPLRASWRTINPKENKLISVDQKFKRTVFVRNVMRVKGIILELVEVVKFVNSCFQWDSIPRSMSAFVLFLVVTYYFEAYMLPLVLLLVFAKHCLWQILSSHFGSKRAVSEEEVRQKNHEEDMAIISQIIHHTIQS